VAVTIEQQIAWERKQSRPASIAAVFSAVATLAGAIIVGLTYQNVPRTGVLDVLSLAERPGPIGPMPSLRTPVFQFYSDHASGIIGASVLRALGFIAIGWAVTYLAQAVRFRRPEFPRVAQPLALVGGVICAVGEIMASIGTTTAVNHFLDGNRSVDAAADLGSGALLGAGQLLGRLVGPLVLAVAIAIISLNAMRLGLLTRFVGVLGMITGVLIIFPIGTPIPIVQIVWLMLLAVIFRGAWPEQWGGTPPAWRTGRPEPWPSVAEQREQRLAEQGGGADVEVETVVDANGTARANGPRSGAPKRKRKRRT
jgi:hypothetical protein